MKQLTLLVLLSIIFIFYNCDSKLSDSNDEGNPPAEGFDLGNSDPAAIELADSVMVAMGGRENWNNTRFISWNFSGRRNLTWDKELGRVRIEAPDDSIIYLVNVNTMEGKVQVKGKELAESDSLKKMLQKAKSIWINDSYWLVMPFKLKDTGVTLKYLGEDTLKGGSKCNLLQLTFKNVGDTPQNKYLLYVDLKDNLIKQWAFFSNATQDSANFVRPWDNYKRYENILLSADRSDGSGPRDVKVSKKLPDKIFEQF